MSKWPPINKIAEDVKSGSTTAVSQVEKALQLIDDHPEIDAILAKIEQRAKDRAQKIDQMVSQGDDPGKLAGVPFIAKDNFLVFGADTTAASNILKGFDAPYQSTVIEKLEAAGAICVAKANLDAFAHGSSTENSDFMVTKNPHDKTRVPGGSSGGSAAVVLLGLTPFALGTDTGGSIRQPASFCGIVGYKPTYGLVSRSGVVAMASSTDVIGPLTSTVTDAGCVLDIIAGLDPLDGTTIERSDKSYAPLTFQEHEKKLKVGIVKEYFEKGLQPGVRKCVETSIQKLKDDGAMISEVSLPSLPLALACYYVLCPAEVSSNLSRYDGQRYGFSNSSTDLTKSYLSSRSLGFGDEAKRRIMIGTYVLSSGYYDAYYQQAQLVRTKIISEFKEAFKSYDILIGPTTSTVAFKIGEHTSDPLEMYMSDIMTVATNLTGTPAISIPCGLADELPVGLHLMADLNEDYELLSFAQRAEEVLV